MNLIERIPSLFPGHPLPKGAQQGDAQRRRKLDNHQHRQGNEKKHLRTLRI